MCVCVCVCVCVVPSEISSFPGLETSQGIVDKGDIYLITAVCMLVALEIVDIGLQTPEACVISAASF